MLAYLVSAHLCCQCTSSSLSSKSESEDTTRRSDSSRHAFGLNRELLGYSICRTSVRFPLPDGILRLTDFVRVGTATFVSACLSSSALTMERSMRPLSGINATSKLHPSGRTYHPRSCRASVSSGPFSTRTRTYRRVKTVRIRVVHLTHFS